MENISQLGSMLLFNEQGMKFVDRDLASTTGDNKHDWAKNSDIKITDSYIPNGADNHFPDNVLDAVKRSTIQRKAFDTIVGVASGQISFVNPSKSDPVSDERLKYLLNLYKELGLTPRKFLHPANSSSYLFGGVPTTLSWASNGREFVLSKVKTRDFKTFRLGAAEMKEGDPFYDKHFYHRNWGWMESKRNKKIRVSEKSTESWLKWEKNQKDNADKVCFMYSYDPERSLSSPVNRTQSFYVRSMDGLSDHYALPKWFSGATFNYVKSDFLLSCFDADEIENGFQAHGTVKVYHKDYKNPESGVAKSTFEKHKKMVAEQFTGGYKSGSLNIIPCSIDGGAVNDSMEFIPTPSTSGRERYTILAERITTSILSGNGAIYPEIFGIRSESKALSENSDKLITGLKILNQMTIKPLMSLFDDPEGGFLNMINDILGIEERAVIIPNLSAFLNIPEASAMHYLHPEQWYSMYTDFGLPVPTKEQIGSGLIRAYSKEYLKTIKTSK